MAKNSSEKINLVTFKKHTTTAILVDGAFYRKRAASLFGKLAPEERAKELFTYCCRHLQDDREHRNLYRIFYYDCPPSDKRIQEPVTKKTIDLGKTELYTWANDFFLELTKQRKIALRMGEVLESSVGYTLYPNSLKALLQGKITVEQLTAKDFSLDFKQKGVDMRIGLDIASLAHKRLVDQIILVAGDSDFIPAAKHARREGIDFILDPMWQKVKPNLLQHVDGLRSPSKRPDNLDDIESYKIK